MCLDGKDSSSIEPVSIRILTSLSAVEAIDARIRNSKARASGAFAARRPAIRGAETARNAETIALTRG